MGRGASDFDSFDVRREGLNTLAAQPTIESLAAAVPAGGYMATCGDNGRVVTDALDALEAFPIEAYRNLPVDVLFRVYETAEDANWHAVAGLAYQAWKEKKAPAPAGS